MSNSTTTSSSPLSAFFSHGFLAVLVGILGLLSSPLVLHILPANIAAIVVAVAAGYKAWSDQQRHNETTATVNDAAQSARVAAQGAVTAANAAETTAASAASASLAQARARAASPMQGGAAL